MRETPLVEVGMTAREALWETWSAEEESQVREEEWETARRLFPWMPWQIMCGYSLSQVGQQLAWYGIQQLSQTPSQSAQARRRRARRRR